MKKAVLILLFFLLVSNFSFSQGRVVINEFMPWTSNLCGGPTAEFVELMNFGPGPVNIGCYILTDGDYSITIPPNTILQPGEFYVISGQDVIPGPCANIDSTITANLNWNTCNCTSGAIPTTGDGLFTDGGSANEQVVLLDPGLTIVDAVIRTFPAETSSSITTSTLSGQCTAQTFDLDLLTINYETIGESAGRGNSFARKLDGDCGWVKDPQQSADATNNTPSDVSDIDYDFAVTGSTDCSNNGSIEIIVNGSNVPSLFPFTYTLAFDTDENYLFELSDSYTTGIDNSPNTIQVGNLAAGNYRITVGSALGCHLHTFPFTILDCAPVLPTGLLSFSVSKNNNITQCRWILDNSENFEKVIIEKSTDGRRFISQEIVRLPANKNGVWNSGYAYDEPTGGFGYYRLRMVSVLGMHTFSPVVNTMALAQNGGKIWPNPARDQLFAELNFTRNEQVSFLVLNMHNQLVLQGKWTVNNGNNLLSLPVKNLPSGSYQLLIQSRDSRQSGLPLRLHFIRL